MTGAAGECVCKGTRVGVSVCEGESMLAWQAVRSGESKRVLEGQARESRAREEREQKQESNKCQIIKLLTSGCQVYTSVRRLE